MWNIVVLRVTSVWILLLFDHITPRASRIHSLEVSTNHICRKSWRLQGLSDALCRNEADFMVYVGLGTDLAIRECQQSFKNRQWDCKTSHKTYNKILKTDTRESAYLNAITSAGVLYAITTACAKGELWQCHCDRTQQKSLDGSSEWKWGGCSDDVQFGYNKSKQYTNVKDAKSDIKGMILSHNNEAGRLAITKHMKQSCKCHGLSGSCALQTCWRRMPPFVSVGNELLNRYDGAPLVTGSNDGFALIPEQDGVKPPTPQDLVYTDRSPNFCDSNTRYGTNGTYGRACIPGSLEPDGCEIMCCNRGYKKYLYNIREKCNCRFIWCCEVQCSMCQSVREVYQCL